VDFNTKNVILLINKIFVILYLNKEYGIQIFSIKFSSNSFREKVVEKNYF